MQEILFLRGCNTTLFFSVYIMTVQYKYLDLCIYKKVINLNI